MIDGLNKITPMHVLYVFGAAAAAGFVFVLLDRWAVMPLQSAVGIAPQGAVI